MTRRQAPGQRRQLRIFGIDPGSERTGYGCVETDGRRHHVVACGAITAAAADTFPHRLARIHRELTALLAECRPEYVAIENLFHASNARSALKLGHARGVAMLAAIQAGCEVVEYAPAEVKRAVVGYGRAEKQQVQHMITLLLGLAEAPRPFDASDALAVALCHLHSMTLHLEPDTTGRAALQGRPGNAGAPRRGADAAGGLQTRPLTSWRHYRPPTAG